MFENLSERIEHHRKHLATISQCQSHDMLAIIDQQSAELTRLKANIAADQPNGDWLDRHGGCRVCGGEIPHGHTENCDHYKLERQLTEARQQRDKSEHCQNDWGIAESIGNLSYYVSQMGQEIDALREAIKAMFCPGLETPYLAARGWTRSQMHDNKWWHPQDGNTLRSHIEAIGIEVRPLIRHSSQIPCQSKTA